MERDTISVAEFAERNGVSERTVNRWIVQREIKSIKIGGSRRIVMAAFLRKLGEATHYPTHPQNVT